MDGLRRGRVVSLGLALELPLELPGARARSRLAERFPTLAGRTPWRALAHVPTPVEPLAWPSAASGRAFVKRDDLVSPLFGGNKVRRFEYLLAEAEAHGARTLVTVGGLASTQVMATALFGRALGFGVSAVLFEQPLTSFARMALATSHAAGARLVRGGGYVGTAMLALGELARAERPFLLMPGASSPTANLGYVEAALELGEQVERGLAPRPDAVLVATGSGGTAAGLAVGFALLGWSTEVVAVRITDAWACNALTLGALVDATYARLRSLAPGAALKSSPRVSVEGRFLGAGYGAPTAEAARARRHLLEVAGVMGEITYSGKALAALETLARERPRANLLYWCTLSSARRGALGSDERPLDPSLSLSPPEGFEDCFEGALPDLDALADPTQTGLSAP
jgi:1-aminocyclopropane-1-carboxylate deaminase/D-cysteine desulfhydrase-like pyridoxal-dependent ACC family enzyme